MAVAKGLRNAPVQITILDRHNYFLFTPLLYQVATAGLSPANIAVPIRKMVRKYRNAEVLLSTVEGVDLSNRRVMTDLGTIDYDFVVIAAGSTSSFFGRDPWRPYVFELKTLNDAVRIRNHVLNCFERAEAIDDRAEQRRLMRIAIVGGGPTGVELAGAFAELARSALKTDFDRIDPTSAEVILIEGGERVLGTFAERLSQSALQSLRSLGVDVRLRQRVTEIRDGFLEVGEERIEAATVIWAAGVQASDVAHSVDVVKDRAGRLSVDEHFRLAHHPHAFAIGDLAQYQDLPGIAPVAIQAGEHVAKVIRAVVDGQSALPTFRYRDKGILATIGRKHAVAQFGRKTFTGTFAWLLWLAVHVMVLADFRNRLVVLIEWFWAYVRYSPGAQIIVEPSSPE